jgi:hypothetical protein
MHESLEAIMAAYKRDVPEGPSGLRPGRLSLEQIEKFSTWFVLSGRGSEADAGDVLHQIMWPSQRR